MYKVIIIIFYSRANILLDDSFRAKLGDFGFAVELPHISGGATLFTAASIAQSEGYYPSEVTSGKYSDRSDVYSYGVVSFLIVIIIMSLLFGDQ